jgi:NADPH:quinone reductase-like Zn-dependent oxidoreductase
MRCLELSSAFGLDHLHVTQRPELVPGAGEVVVRVKAASLNYRDYLMVTGAYNPRQALPLIPGSDAVGVIEAVGPAVAWKVGTRVAGCFAPHWQDGAPEAETLRQTLGGPLDGALSQQMKLPAHGVVEVPAHLSDEEAATLPCAAVTAWNAVKNVKPGDVVLLQGTGGVSLFALHFARLRGATAIITSSSDEKLERARALGASHLINYARDPEWGKAAKTLTGGRGVDLVVEVGGAQTISHSLKAIRIGGEIAMIGVLSGAKTEIALTQILMQAIKVQGILVGSRADFVAMNRALTAHASKPVVDSTYPLADAQAAFAALAAGRHFGKIVVTLD